MVQQISRSEERKAARFFLHTLSIPQQLAVIDEIILTRERELRIAFPEVERISSGVKERTDRTGRLSIRRVSTIVFHVRGKWSTPTSKGRESLPKHLLTYWGGGKKRRLVAVRTDVRESAVDAIPHASTRHSIYSDPGLVSKEVATGNLCCAIRIKGIRGCRYAVSCRHVLSASELLHPDRDQNVLLALYEDYAERCLESTSYFGRLGQIGAYPSYDVEFALITDKDEARRALGAVTFNGERAYVRDLPSIRDLGTYYVVVGRGGRAVPIKLRYSTTHYDFVLPYETPAGDIDVAHALVIESVVAGSGNDIPRKGDSGSPVLSSRRGGSLVGLHFAGSESQRRSYMIPAAEIFPSPKFPGWSENKRIFLTNL